MRSALRTIVILGLVLPLLVLPLLLLGGGCAGGDGHGDGKYHCPMHPTYVSDRPGDCPICGMRLVPDRVAVTIPAQGLELAGVQTAPAERGRMGHGVRTTGEVKPDERLVRHVHTKIDGWIEKLYVNSTGQEVRRGQPILSIYAPELLTAQEEFVRARAAAERFAASSVPEVRDGAEDIVRAARRRLELLDVPPAVIAELEKTGRATRAITLVAPVSGVVTSKDIFEGQQVEPGMELFTVTDLSRVWVEADIYEQEAAAIRPGLPARISSPYQPGLERQGRVAFVYPFLDPESRTLRVRFELQNRDLALKPAMFVDVAFDLAAQEGILVPDSAVLDTGTRQVVFVQQGKGRFVPRDVRLGVRSDGRALVLSGVAEGERVAVRANFLLDAESRLKAALGAGGTGSAGGDGGKAGTP